MLSHLPLILLIIATLSYPTVALPNHQAVFSEQPPTSTSLSTALVPVPVPTNEGWIDPRINGGQFLDFTTETKGEPLNVIISAFSDPFILTESGLHHYAKSIGFSEECLGLHYGHIHQANLGDGIPLKPEQFLARQYYFPIWGTCWESFYGGHHFRAWRQNGTLAPSGAWFLAVSKESQAKDHHNIVKDGYNLGRNWLVDKAVDGSYWKGMWWKAEVEWRKGLLKPGKEGVNHGIEQDGRVAILTVKRL